MLEAVADYASISLVNARLFKALEARAKRLESVLQETKAQQGSATILTQLKKGLKRLLAQIDALRESTDPMELKSGLDLLMSMAESLLEETEGQRVEKQADPGGSA
jgi:hypothetical protein